ncbi:hypothetical protein YC2023_045109 [Brassica napus]
MVDESRTGLGNDDDDRWQVVMIQLVGFLVVSIQLGSTNSSIQIVSRNIKILAETSQNSAQSCNVCISRGASNVSRMETTGDGDNRWQVVSGNDDDEDRWQVVMVKLVWFVVVSMRYAKDDMMLLTYTTLLYLSQELSTRPALRSEQKTDVSKTSQGSMEASGERQQHRAEETSVCFEVFSGIGTFLSIVEIIEQFGD